MSDTMPAIRAYDYGPADQLKLEETPVPQPGEGQVRVRLHAAGVNPADWKFRAGYMQQWMPLTFPWTPGLEGAGVVDAIGPGVTGLAPGEAVFGIINAAYAGYALASPTDLTRKPAGLSFEEAAALPVGVLTAWGAVTDAELKPGQRVLVQGGAGGVGAYAVQLAAQKGAQVIATASAANVDFVRSLGAHEVVDYNAQPFESVVRDVDAVIDTVGGEVAARSWAVLKPGGILVTVAAQLSPDEAEARGVRAQVSGRASAAVLKEIVALIEAGQLKPIVGRIFPLAEAADAQRLSETGHGRGRILLKM